MLELPSAIPPEDSPATPAPSATPPPVDPTPAGPPRSGRPVLWAKDLQAATGEQAFWLWHGYLALGNVTPLTSQWKTGKTTLVSVLLSRLQTGGTLAGLPLAPGRAVVVTEEGPRPWQRRCRQLAFGDHVGWMCRPFRGKPRPDEWLDLIDQIADLHHAHHLNLLVIDPLASFLPGRGESDAAAMLDTRMPLQRLTARDMSVLIAHHPRKGDVIAGQAARGSGALSGYVDIIMEMDLFSRGTTDDRRREVAQSAASRGTTRRPRGR